jgi:hypothetical protein
MFRKFATESLPSHESPWLLDTRSSPSGDVVRLENSVKSGGAVTNHQMKPGTPALFSADARVLSNCGGATGRDANVT